MQFGDRFSLFFKISLPLLILLLLDVYPASHVVVNALSEARAAENRGEPQAAAAALRQVVEREPWRTGLWEQIGRDELAAGRVAEALAALRQAEQAGILSPDGRFQLGEAYIQQGEDRPAEDAWQRLLRVAGPSARVFERLAQVQRDQRDLPAAVETLRAWRAFAPQDSRVAFLLGMMLCVVKPEEALPLLVESAQKDTRFTGDVQTLRTGLTLASTTDNKGYGWLMIGRALGRIQQWDLAAEAFRQAVKVSPGYAEAWGFLGEAYYHIDNSGKAELDRANTLAPESPVVRALQALYWRRQGQPQKALDYLKAIAKQEPNEPTWQVEIGNTLVGIGDYIAAQEYFKRAVDLAPKNALYWQYLARFSVETNTDIAGLGIPAARKAIMLAENDPAALDVMGVALMKQGDLVSAERFLQRAVDRDATYAPACLHLGQLYLQTADPDLARLFLKRAASLAGDDQVGKTARRLLESYFGEGG